MDSFHSSDDLFKDLTMSGMWNSLCKQKSASNTVSSAKTKRGDMTRIWTSHHNEVLACTGKDTGRVNTQAAKVKVNSRSGK
jgi:hypothetical protein